MRILDNKSYSSLKDITIYLKLEEARELLSDLQNLIDSFGNNEHVHINDDVYEHEITVVLYEESKLEHFNQRSKDLILKDI